MFFRDRPRAAAPEGNVNQEYLSLFSDRVPVLCGRTPLQCYTQFMVPALPPPPTLRATAELRFKGTLITLLLVLLLLLPSRGW